MLSNLFDESGFEVQVASNGAAGLRLAARLRPEVVVVGDSLPELSPEQLIAELKPPRGGWGTRVVRVRDLLRWEAPPSHAPQLATTLRNDNVPALGDGGTGPHRRHNTSVTREL